MQSELIFRTERTAQVKVSTIPFRFKHSLLDAAAKAELQILLQHQFSFERFRPNSIKMFYVLDYFLQTGLISAAVGLALKGFFFQPCSLLPFTDTIVSLWSLCARTMDVNLPPWIPPQPTICQRGTKSDVRSIMRAVLGNPAAESPPCRRVPPRTLPLT